MAPIYTDIWFALICEIRGSFFISADYFGRDEKLDLVMTRHKKSGTESGFNNYWDCFANARNDVLNYREANARD